MTTSWSTNDIPDLTGRTVIITGANSGIGRAAAHALAGAGGRVVLAVRDTEKGQAAAATMPSGRLMTPDDVARLSLYLLSEASEPMSGALIDYGQLVLGGLD